MNDGLYQIKTSYFCAGLVVSGGTVTEAAPILRWALGKPFFAVQAWVAGKCGTVTLVGNQ